MNGVKSLFALLLLLSTAPSILAQGGYKITLKLDQYTMDTVILGYRLGKNTYVKDTAAGRNSKGEFVFEDSKEPLKGGVYLILVKPNNNYFEFLVANDEEQKNLYIQTTVGDGKDMLKDLKFKNSKENDLFLEYMNFLKKQREKSTPFEAAFKKSQESKDSVGMKANQAELKKIEDEVLEYQKQMRAKNPNALVTKLVLAAENPVVPKEIENDKTKAFYYFRAHYFDKMDWSDARLIRTPTLETRLEYYLDQLTVQHYDSVIIAADYLIQVAIKGGNKDMYQYVSSHILNKYAKTNVICMDAVYVAIGEKYYCNPKNRPEWVDSAQLEKICTNVAELRLVRCGQPAPDIVLRNIKDGTQVNMRNIKAKYTFVYFWDPTCGNCSKNSKKLAPIYDKWKSKGVEFIGICSKTWNEKSGCEEKIKEVGMNWINLSDDAYPLAWVKKAYDVKVNPFLYMLDENKKIMWKRLDPEQVDEILSREFGIEYKKPEKTEEKH